ncbi:MAG: pilus assembly protein PilP [Proteobacteria bacterium]|nr:pilus assembly protein PilP [Pseudomonadota bacterium]
MNARHKALVRCIAVVVAASALAGCGRGITSDPDLKAYVSTVLAKPGPPLEPIPVMQKFETFLYTDQGLRDPFSMPVDLAKAGSGPHPDKDRPRQPLEAFPLDSLVMNGTLGAGSTIVGLVMSPDKVTHRVVPGNYVGQNDGKVIEVTPTKINITELVSDGAGGWIERPASISLPNQ